MDCEDSGEFIKRCCCFLVAKSCPTLSQPQWTVAHQAPSTRGIFQAKNTRVGCHFLLQRIFPTQGSNLHLLRWQAGSLPLSHQGSQTDNLLGAFYVPSIVLEKLSNKPKSLPPAHTLCARMAYGK